MRKLSKENNQLIIGILLFIIYLIALIPLRKIGFTTSDDMDNFFLSNQILSTFSYGYSLSLRLSRFYNIFTAWVYFIPYLSDSKLYYDLVFILPFVACFILFTRLIHRIYDNYSITLFAAVFMAACFQIAAFHSITSAYPFYFTFPFCLVLVSIHIMLSYYKNKRYYLLIFSSIILFISAMFYESFLSYFVIPILISIWKNKVFNQISKENIKASLRELSPYLILLIFYLIVYIVYRINHPIQYWGSKTAGDFSVLIALKSSTQLGFYSLPLMVFFDTKAQLISYSLDFNNGFSLSSISLIAYVQGIIVAYLVFYALIAYKKINSKTLLIAFFIGVLIYYLPLLPLSLSSKYFDQNLYNYVPTFFAFLGVCLAFTSIIFLLFNYAKRYRLSRYVFLFLITLSMFFVTVFTNHSNNLIAKDLEYSNYRLKLVEEIFQGKESNKFSNNPICMEEAHNTTSIMGKWITGQIFTWNKYIEKTTAKKVNAFEKYDEFYNTFKNDSSLVWVSYFRQAQKNNDALMYFAQVRGIELTKNQKDIISDRVVVYYLSSYKSFNLSFVCDEMSDVYVKDRKLNSVGAFHSLNMKFNHNDELPCFEIIGEGIVISSLNINNILNYVEELNFGNQD